MVYYIIVLCRNGPVEKNRSSSYTRCFLAHKTEKTEVDKGIRYTTQKANGVYIYTHEWTEISKWNTWKRVKNLLYYSYKVRKREYELQK